MAALLEALQQFAESAAQKPAGTGTAEAPAQLAQQAGGAALPHPPHNFEMTGRIGGTARPGGLGFAPNGREPRLLMPRQSWRAVVMLHLLEAGRGDVIAPSIQIEEASVAIVGKALLVIPSRI